MKKYSSITRVNSRRTSRNKKIGQTLFFGIFLLVLMFLLPKIFGGFASLIFTPINLTKTWFQDSSSSLPYFFRDRTDLVNQIVELKKQPAGGVESRLTIKRLEAENVDLRSQLTNEIEERILAGVIARPNFTPYDVLVLDVGSSGGVKEGALVYIDNQTVIGVIKKSYINSSVVELVSTPGFRTTVYIFGPNIFTTAEGVGGGVIKVSVPQGINMSENDLVVLPGVNPGVFGEIAVVESSPTQPEQFGFVTTKVPLNSVRLVSVGKEPLQPVSFEQARTNVESMYADIFTVPVPEDVLIDVFGNSSSTASSTATTTEVINTP